MHELSPQTDSCAEHNEQSLGTSRTGPLAQSSQESSLERRARFEYRGVEYDLPMTFGSIYHD